MRYIRGFNESVDKNVEVKLYRYLEENVPDIIKVGDHTLSINYISVVGKISNGIIKLYKVKLYQVDDIYLDIEVYVNRYGYPVRDSVEDVRENVYWYANRPELSLVFLFYNNVPYRISGNFDILEIIYDFFRTNNFSD